MHPIPRRTIETNLQQKGFVRKDTHHRYFHHEINGRTTGTYTYTSTGSNFREYGVTLLKRMVKQLGLRSLAEVRQLLECPMDGDEYISKLKEYGKIRAND